MMRNSPKILRSFLACSLLFGALFVPSRVVEAGFFSSLFGVGDQALADTSANSVALPSPGSNSQNIALLQANVSSASILPDKSNTTPSTTDPTDPSADTSNIVSDNALQSATGPLGVSDGTDTTDTSLDQTSVYVVHKGDTAAVIAKMFNVSVNTILAANDLKKTDKLTEGQVLFILPITGIEYTVTKGQTLKKIAALYKVDITDIAAYNGISQDAALTVGDQLLIPGADTMTDEGGSTPAPNLGSALSRDLAYYTSHSFIQDLVNYFIDPVPTGRKTQGLHGPGHRGIDIGAAKGTPILASASGTVSLAHTGWSGGYGNMVIIDHPNGTRTLYGHMSKIATFTGDTVNQGEVIGYVGSTGHSTGPHLHFEVFNARNPGADWSWKAL
jgi:murein DD-endopeptidase MepM/ murein hydrolase activator NlpD